MKLKIAETTYKLKAAARTLFVYRHIWGESFQKVEKTDEEWALKLLRFLYSGIDGDRPEWESFFDAAVKVEGILTFAAAFQSAVMGKPKKQAKQESISSEDNEYYDEYRLLALLITQAVPEWIIDELPLFDVLRVVEEMTEIKGGKKESKRIMSREEILAFYGVQTGGKQHGKV